MSEPPAKIACRRQEARRESVGASAPATAGCLSSVGRRTRRSLTATDLKKCIVCQKDKSDVHNRRQSGRLTQCMTFEAGLALEKATVTRRDAVSSKPDDLEAAKRVLQEVEGGDLITKEILYHKSSCGTFTHKQKLERLTAVAVEKESENPADGQAFQTAFAEAVQFVDDEILQSPTNVCSMTDLCQKFDAVLQEEGVRNVRCRSYVLQAWLVAHFGKRISFHRPQKRNQSEFVFNTDASRGPLIEQCAKALADFEVASAE